MTIKVDVGNERIDKYLINHLDISRSKIQKLIKNGLVSVDGKIISSNFIVRDNMEIKIEEETKKDYEIESIDIDVEIVYEDKYLLIINKPSGLVVHPAPGHNNDTLVNALVNHTQLSNNDERPGIVHRIDKDTSGLLIVAKDDKTHEMLSEMIKNKEVTRKYIALVQGIIKEETGTIDAPIGRDIVDRKKYTVTDINAKDAITHFRVLERLNDATLIECKLDTGRTHQIRVHMKYIGHPIVNDKVYGYKKVINDYGQLLHSYYIKFKHPITGEELEFTCDMEDEMKRIIDTFR